MPMISSPSVQYPNAETMLNAEANVETQEEKPGVIEGIRKGIRDRVKEILENNPITRVVRRVQSWKQKISHLLRWEEGNKVKSPPSTPESPSSTSTPIAPPEPKQQLHGASPFGKADQEYRERLKQKEELITHDMATISAQISRQINPEGHTFERNEKFAAFVGQRADKMKQTPIDAPSGIQHCSPETLSQHGCVAENILRVPIAEYPTAAKLMEAFMKSKEHRKNLKGDYKEYNVAVRYDEEHQMLCAVIVYAKGKPRENLSETPLPSGTPDSSSQIDLLEPYREALKEESGKHPDIFIESFEDEGLVLVNKATAMKAHYVFKADALPPNLIRFDLDKKPVLILIENVFEDFKKMEQEKNGIPRAKELEKAYEVPSKTPAHHDSALETEMESGLH